jgi:hypothetical protein
VVGAGLAPARQRAKQAAFHSCQQTAVEGGWSGPSLWTAACFARCRATARIAPTNWLVDRTELDAYGGRDEDGPYLP